MKGNEQTQEKSVHCLLVRYVITNLTRKSILVNMYVYMCMWEINLSVRYVITNLGIK